MGEHVTDTAQAPDAVSGTIDTQLRRDTLGLPGVFMQGIGTISPAFSQLASFTSTVALAAIVSPLAFLLGGIVLAIQALCTGQLAKEIPSAGGWYTWIAKTLHPRAGFFAGWLVTFWLVPCGVLVLSYLGATAMEPAIKAYYGVLIPWWVYPVCGVALVAYVSYRGIEVSQKLLITTGSIEIVIMVALAVSGLVHPGPGGFSVAPLNPANFGHAPDVFLAIVFAVFAYSGWEAIGPLAEETKNPRKYVPIALVGSVLILMVYEVLVTWGNLVGVGVDKIPGIPTASAWPIATMAQHLWHGVWVLLLFALLNSAVAVCLGAFNGGTRTLFAMGRSGAFPAFFGKVSKARKVPDNAVHVQVAVSAACIGLCFAFGVADVFFTWAIAFTLGLIAMYMLADIGVIRYYMTTARERMNVLLHVIFPVATIVAVGYVGYKTIWPLPPAPEKWAPVLLGAYLLIGVGVLVYLHSRGNETWMVEGQRAMEETLEQAAAAD